MNDKPASEKQIQYIDDLRKGISRHQRRQPESVHMTSDTIINYVMDRIQIDTANLSQSDASTLIKVLREKTASTIFAEMVRNPQFATLMGVSELINTIRAFATSKILAATGKTDVPDQIVNREMHHIAESEPVEMVFIPQSEETELEYFGTVEQELDNAWSFDERSDNTEREIEQNARIAYAEITGREYPWYSTAIPDYRGLALDFEGYLKAMEVAYQRIQAYRFSLYINR